MSFFSYRQGVGVESSKAVASLISMFLVLFSCRVGVESKYVNVIYRQTYFKCRNFT
jgi:hypothetical protein